MPGLPVIARTATSATLPDGSVVHTFGGCDYLALAHDRRVEQAIVDAVYVFGLSSNASRQTTGNTAAHNALESALAEFLQVEDCLLLPDGYTANIAACQGLALPDTTAPASADQPVALLDTKAHASLLDSVKAAGLRLQRFAHRDPASLAAALHRLGSTPALVLTDGVFTADGSLAPISDYLNALRPIDHLLVDDCHGLGVLGPGGCGSVAHARLDDDRIIITSSLAKGLGCAGGLIAGSRSVVERARQATAFVCTTPIAPAMAAGTNTALAILIHEPERLERLHTNALVLRSGLSSLGLCDDPYAPDAPPAIPIAAFTLGTVEQMTHVEQAMRSAGYLLPLINYPGGPASAYFRLSVTAAHDPHTIEAMTETLKRLCPGITERIGAQAIGSTVPTMP